MPTSGYKSSVMVPELSDGTDVSAPDLDPRGVRSARKRKRVSVVIPTRFERRSLGRLIGAASAVCPVVIVHTEPGHADVPDVVNVHDYRRNIHHWWNTGLDACDGPAVVLNDDVTVTPTAIRALLHGLRVADLVYVAGRRRTAPTPISGWCFGVNRLRPDPAFTWWCGDDDLYRRARITQLVSADVHHAPRPDMGPAPEFVDAVKADRALYARRWIRAS